jgi:hypothetical protein
MPNFLLFHIGLSLSLCDIRLDWHAPDRRGGSLEKKLRVVGDEGEKVEHMVEIEERKEDVGLGTELGLNVEELNYVSGRKIVIS